MNPKLMALIDTQFAQIEHLPTEKRDIISSFMITACTVFAFLSPDQIKLVIKFLIETQEAVDNK